MSLAGGAASTEHWVPGVEGDGSVLRTDSLQEPQGKSILSKVLEELRFWNRDTWVLGPHLRWSVTRWCPRGANVQGFYI